MKKTFTLLFAIVFSIAAIGQEIIAKWTFASSDVATSLKAEEANTLNTEKTMFTENISVAIEMKNGISSKAAQVSGWENGDGQKSWQTEVNTTGRASIFISSLQTAGATDPGPKDFKLQYRLGSAGDWTDVTGGNITVANDWTTGVLNRLALPSECDNQASLFIRWVMTSNLDINGAELISAGKAKIDNVIIESDVVLALDNLNLLENKIKMFPNPCVNYFEIETINPLRNIKLYSVSGSKVYDVDLNTNTHRVITSDLKEGIYIVVLTFENSNRKETKSIVIH